MPHEYPGWIALPDAAKQIGLHYEVLRRMVKAKGKAAVFSPGRFSHATKRPPIYLRVEEVKAFCNGGVDAVRAIRESGQNKKTKGKKNKATLTASEGT